MKRVTLLLLALSMILLLYNACSGEGESKTTETTVPNISVQSETEPVETELKPDLPDKKYDGYKFRILTTDEEGAIRSPIEIAAEQTGAVLDDAVFARNLQLSEDLGIEVVWLTGKNSGNGWVTDFKNSVTAGDDTYDILVATQRLILQNAYGYGLEVSDLPYVKLSNPWWDELVIESTALAKKTYGLTGALNLVDDGATWCFEVNRTIEKDNKISDLYEVVRQGKWTIDKLKETISGMSHDLNGDGQMDVNDQWAYSASGNVGVSLLWACGGGYSHLDKDGKVVLTVSTDRNLTILNKMYDILTDTSTTILMSDFGSGPIQRKAFVEGHSFLNSCMVCYTYMDLRDMKDQWGLLPNPKFDESQENYISTAQEWCATMWMVPKTASDAERSSVILEDLCYQSSKILTPAFYDTVLAYQVIPDPETSEMLDYILKGRVVYDLAYAINWGNLSNVNNAVQDRSGNKVASTLASIADAVKAAADAEYANWSGTGK